MVILCRPLTITSLCSPPPTVLRIRIRSDPKPDSTIKSHKTRKKSNKLNRYQDFYIFYLFIKYNKQIQNKKQKL